MRGMEDISAESFISTIRQMSQSSSGLDGDARIERENASRIDQQRLRSRPSISEHCMARAEKPQQGLHKRSFVDGRAIAIGGEKAGDARPADQPERALPGEWQNRQRLVVKRLDGDAAGTESDDLAENGIVAIPPGFPARLGG